MLLDVLDPKFLEIIIRASVRLLLDKQFRKWKLIPLRLYENDLNRKAKRINSFASRIDS